MHSQNAKRSISLTMLIGALLLAPLTQAQEPTPPPPRREFSYEVGRPMLPRLPGAPPAPQDEPSDGPPACAPWSQLAFASYRNEGDWEVYIANGDGAAQTGVTNRGEQDLAPKLNQGCTRLVYQSLEDNGYEVYVINPDGSGRARLTSNTAYDGVPCWSPGSAHIAFQTDRDDNSEVYVMNADGSGQANLTNHPAYDGMPAWSTDGKIAFVSNRTGQYEIWAMNPDGTGQTQVTHGVPWAQYPCWSPDGSQIAFSNDDNGDGFMDINVVNADGTGLTFLAGHAENMDFWYPAWSPDGEWIAYSVTKLKEYHGQWYWTRSDIYGEELGVSYSDTRLVGSGYDWQPHWGTQDAQPPTSQVHDLPTYSRIGELVSWSGTDVGLAGLKSYDVQYRDGETGPWIDWLTNVPYTCSYFRGMGGHEYYFRCRARDRAENLELYPGTGVYPHTTPYTYRLSGYVRDIRDTPVTNATVDITPLPLFAATTSFNGGYDVYLTGLDSNTAHVSKTDYGTLPPMPIQAVQVAQHATTYLPPVDDRIQNGGFETSSSTPIGWQSQGTILPTVTDSFRHTGNYAIELAAPLTRSFASALNVYDVAGNSQHPQMVIEGDGTVHIVLIVNNDIYYTQRESCGTWSTPQNISNNATVSHYPKLAIDRSGLVHVVWVDGTTDDFFYNGYIYYAWRGIDGIWSSPQDIPDSSKTWEPPQMVVDQSGIVYIVWSGDPANSYDDDIYYAQLGSDGAWLGPINVSNTPRTSTSPQLAMDGSGVIHVVWADASFRFPYLDVCYAQRDSNGNWSGSQLLSSASGNSQYPSLGVDRNSTVHVVWLFDNIPCYSQRGNSGVWSSPLQVPNAEPGFAPRLAVEQDGTVHIVWSTGMYSAGDAFYAERNNVGTWSYPQNLSTDPEYTLSPQLLVDKSGNVHVVWQSDQDIKYTRRRNDGGWSSNENIPGASYCPGSVQLAVDGNGFAHVVWYNGRTGTDARYNSQAIAEQTGDSTIAQAIALPGAMHYPTLSFLYRLGVAAPGDSGWLEATVSNGIASTQVFSTSASTPGWAHAWADMSPWAGQTITLTFNVHNEAGAPATWAYLDEVSLGSAYPNLWVSKTSSTVPPGGGPVRYTLTYGNLGGVPAQDVRITDTLPAGLAFLSASVPPTSTAPLVWNVGDLAAGAGPYTIIVTATVAAGTPAWTTLVNTVTIGAATPEIERDNNTAVAPVFVGYRLYLPLVAKTG